MHRCYGPECYVPAIGCVAFLALDVAFLVSAFVIPFTLVVQSACFARDSMCADVLNVAAEGCIFLTLPKARVGNVCQKSCAALFV